MSLCEPRVKQKGGFPQEFSGWRAVAAGEPTCHSDWRAVAALVERVIPTGALWLRASTCHSEEPKGDEESRTGLQFQGEIPVHPGQGEIPRSARNDTAAGARNDTVVGARNDTGRARFLAPLGMTRVVGLGMVR